jgi:hypothetical protein
VYAELPRVADGDQAVEGSRLKYEEIFEQAGGGKVVFELSNTGGDKSHVT